MTEAEQDALAERIVDFLNAVSGRNDRLEHCYEAGFQIFPEVGSAFELEIVGPTKLETALQYFEHRFRVTHRLSKEKNGILKYFLSFVSMASFLTRKERLEMENRLARMRNWADVNLVHLYREQQTLTKTLFTY